MGMQDKPGGRVGTMDPYTAAELEKLSDGEIADLAARKLGISSRESMWEFTGVIVDHMREKGFTYKVDATGPDRGIDVCLWAADGSEYKTTAVTLPRAVATAAILACQAQQNLDA
jgi:hypothetical protein